MKEKVIEIESQYGGVVKNICISQESDILTIMLPGSGYINAKPLLYYSNKIALELGLDTLCLNYGFQIFNKEFDLNSDREIEILVKEAEEIIKKCIDRKYKKLIFIGKSLGTIVQSRLSNSFSKYDQAHVYLTPVDKTLEVPINHSCLLISGTKDKKIDPLNIEKLEDIKEVKLLKIDGGNHSLENTDVVESIIVLSKVMKTLKEFLINNI